MSRIIDPKYRIEGDEILNLSGVPIPLEEPLILFRARDRHALAALRKYQDDCESDACTEFHMAGIANRIDAFTRFRQEHPDKMKQPGITKGK